ncbi:mitochondrial ribosomal protein L28-domain-containing protein [Kalaharituber pfeilii]|nr:mitochondrial ribosomal protein L28-domain-containing protein [Kalaharituber pfeilii]
MVFPHGLFSAARPSFAADKTLISSLLSAPSSTIHSSLASVCTGIPNGPTTFIRCMAKKSGGRVRDPRVRMIRYSLNHPLTPRPLKFGTMRMLRHWTIHRAWQLYQRKLRTQRELELERQYNKIRDACEELARTDQRLFRIATAKKGVGYFPVEMRIPTDTPSREGWNYGWRRQVK